MKKFSKIVIKDKGDCWMVYDEDLKEGIDLFPADQDGKYKLLDYLDYLLSSEEE